MSKKIVAALIVGVVLGVVAGAAWSGVVGVISGIVVPSSTSVSVPAGFSVEGFKIDVGKVSGSWEGKTSFKIIAPYNAKLTLTVSVEGPVSGYKITIYDSEGNYVGMLSPYLTKTTLPVYKGENEFTAYITLVFEDVKEPEEFKITLEAYEQ